MPRYAHTNAMSLMIHPNPDNPGLHEVRLLLDASEQPQTTHELGRLLLTWTDGPIPTGGERALGQRPRD